MIILGLNPKKYIENFTLKIHGMYECMSFVYIFFYRF